MNNTIEDLVAEARKRATDKDAAIIFIAHALILKLDELDGTLKILIDRAVRIANKAFPNRVN